MAKDYFIAEERYTASPLKRRETVWQAIGRLNEHIHTLAAVRGQKALTLQAYHEGGRFVRIDYLFLIPLEDLFPKDTDTIH